ncbi:hypothetical protein N0V88_000359 [Collariella sp. IMI 366227]|nr:hypothetical protein N0V88_000359 [Collariella sp. IMI 366227]
MATAAVADASRKDHRRRELDRQIAEAKSDLARTLEVTHARDLAAALDAPYPETSYDPQPQMPDILHDLLRLLPSHLDTMVKDHDRHYHWLARKRRELGMALFVAEPIRGTPQTMIQCMNVMAAEDKDQTQSHREPRNDDDPDSAATMIRMLRSDGYPKYSHTEVDPAAAMQHRASLNQINTKILEEWAPQLRERQVAKICYNLLVCPVIPNMQNYNTLILGFSLLGEFNLAQVVVDSFLHLSHMKPTGATYLCLLHHYRLKNDIVGFHAILRRFFGTDPRGIGLKRANVEYVKNDPKLWDWARSTDVGLAKDWVVERAPLNKDVIEALMEGLINFDMVRHAARIFVSCLSQGWTIDGDLVHRLFHACLCWLDTEAIRVLVRGLLDHMDKTSELLLHPGGARIPFVVVRQLRYMLSVLQATMLERIDTTSAGAPSSSSSSSSPNDSHHEVTRQAQKENMARLVTAIWIRYEKKQQRQMRFWLHASRLRLYKPNVPVELRLERVTALIDRGMRAPGRRLRKSEFIMETTRIMWLAEEVTKGYYQVERFEKQLYHLLAWPVPQQLRQVMWPDPNMTIPERIAAHQPYVTPGTLAYELVGCWEKRVAIRAEVKEAMLEALPPEYVEEGEEDGKVVPC